MYKVHHNGTPPKRTTFADQMTKKTNVDGTVNATAGLYGPYFQGLVPANPYKHSNALVTYTATTPGTPPTGSADSGASVGNTMKMTAVFIRITPATTIPIKLSLRKS